MTCPARMTAEQYRAEAGKPKRNKFGAVRTTVDGITFASKREAEVYAELKLRERAGEIIDLEPQPRFVLSAKPPVAYVGDFRFIDRTSGRVRVIDVKGRDTPASRIKRAWLRQHYGIEVEIVR